MRITWIGHACFLLEASNGSVLTDPFAEELPLVFPDIAPDIVTISHDHFDHNAVGRVRGTPAIVQSVGRLSVRGTDILGIASYHDDRQGSKRGENIIYRIDLDGLSVAHLGDLGAPLGAVQLAALEGIDVVLIPVGGTYTIDAHQAAALVRSLPGLRVVIPMHFKTEALADWPIDTVDRFAQTMQNVRRIEASQAVLTKETLPASTEVWILNHA